MDATEVQEMKAHQMLVTLVLTGVVNSEIALADFQSSKAKSVGIEKVSSKEDGDNIEVKLTVDGGVFDEIKDYLKKVAKKHDWAVDYDEDTKFAYRGKDMPKKSNDQKFSERNGGRVKKKTRDVVTNGEGPARGRVPVSQESIDESKLMTESVAIFKGWEDMKEGHSTPGFGSQSLADEVADAIEDGDLGKVKVKTHSGGETLVFPGQMSEIRLNHRDKTYEIDPNVPPKVAKWFMDLVKKHRYTEDD